MTYHPHSSVNHDLSKFLTEWRAIHTKSAKILEKTPEEVDFELAERLSQFFRKWTECGSPPLTGVQALPLASRLQSFFSVWQQLPPTVTPTHPPPSVDWVQREAELREFFKSFTPALSLLHEERRLGNTINVWKASGLGGDELRNSKVLGWLLDRNGDHGQRGEILQRILAFISKNDGELPSSEDAKHAYWTRIESCPLGERESRVDIEIDGSKFLLFIEVKINAAETNDQLDRYLSIADSKAGRRPWALIYLTRSGQLPIRFRDNPPRNLKALAWSDIAELLASHAQALPICFSSKIILQFTEHILLIQGR